MSVIKFPKAVFSSLADTTVAYEARRGASVFRGTCAASDMGEAFTDPLAAAESASTLKTRVFVVEARGENSWNLSTPPQIGDKLTVAAGASYAVTRVDDFAGSFTLTCKEC